MAGDEAPVADGVLGEICSGINRCAGVFKSGLQKEGDGLGQLDGFFLGVGEDGGFLSGDELRAIGKLHIHECCRAVADRADGSVVLVDAGGDFLQGFGIRKIPDTAVATGEKDRAEFLGIDFGEGDGFLDAGLIHVGVAEFFPERSICLILEIEAFWIEWREPALGAGEGDGVAVFRKNLMGMGCFGEEEAGESAGIAELCMVGENQVNGRFFCGVGCCGKDE